MLVISHPTRPLNSDDEWLLRDFLNSQGYNYTFRDHCVEFELRVFNDENEVAEWIVEQGYVLDEY